MRDPRPPDEPSSGGRCFFSARVVGVVRFTRDTDELRRQASRALFSSDGRFIVAPVFKPEWIEKGMHLSAIQPNELGSEVMCKADVAATLLGDCDPVFIKSHGLHVPDEPKGERPNPAAKVGREGLVTLPELLLERKTGRNSSRGRTSSDQVTCFLNPMGIGSQFAAVGAVVYRRAMEQARGNNLPTEWFTEKEIS